ncbi:MAG: sugar ABC transporter permease, partial [Clostridia bacterium]|nr:sugar ABC transporter permease [Clostridia bacterium]
MVQKSRVNRAQLIALLLPGLLVFGMFTIYPIVRLFWMSLCDMSFSSMLTQPFAGLLNYREVFSDGTFRMVFVNSVVYTLITVPMTLACAVALALALNRAVKGAVGFRTVFFFPYVASMVAICVCWRFMMMKDGPI